MLKKISLIIGLFSLNASALNVDLIKKLRVDYENGSITSSTFRILCIDGYKWLELQSGYSGSVSQMFDDKNKEGYAQPIKCKNKSDEK